ncbi:hypothetical protein ONZ45_g18089 [Pleurotus djamor]|nr:hypothetical protein ONZ45_g18089 [Pleurotus djamor]
MVSFADRVVADPTLLTKWKAEDESQPLSPSEGRVGAVFRDTYFITLPNSDYIPKPAMGNDCEIFRCEDGRYGAQDYCRWPQSYLAEVCHLGCVLKKPTETSSRKDTLVMWDTLRHEHFYENDSSCTSGLGRVVFAYREQIQKHVNDLLTRFNAVCDKPELFNRNHQHQRHVIAAFTQLAAMSDRLTEVNSTFDQAVFMVSDVQRCWLDLSAYMYYMLQAKPTMQTSSPTVVYPPYQFIGSFTNNLSIVEEYARAGIPVWFIRPLPQFSNVRIDKVVTLRPYIELNLNPARYAKRLYFGRDDSYEKYRRMQMYSRNFFSYLSPSQDSMNGPRATLEPPPVEDLEAPPPKRVKLTSQPTPSTSQQHIVPVAQRPRLPAIDPATFKPSTHDFSPPTRKVWKSALASIDKRPACIVAEYKQGDNGFAFPDSSIFIPPPNSKTSVLRTSAIFVTCATYWSTFVHCLSASSQNRRFLTTDEWRKALKAAANVSGDIQPLEASPQGRKMSRMAELLQGWAEVNGVELAPLSTSTTWRGETLSVGTLPSTKLANAMLWELNECNFPVEFQALDIYMSACQPGNPLGDDELGERTDMVRQCFPGLGAIPGGDETTVSSFRANAGLSSPILATLIPFLVNFATVPLGLATRTFEDR